MEAFFGGTMDSLSHVYHLPPSLHLSPHHIRHITLSIWHRDSSCTLRPLSPSRLITHHILGLFLTLHGFSLLFQLSIASSHFSMTRGTKLIIVGTHIATSSSPDYFHPQSHAPPSLLTSALLPSPSSQRYAYHSSIFSWIC